MGQRLKSQFAALPKPKETEWELELPEEREETNGEIELSEEDAAERDRRDQALREAAEKADFKRRTQVLQRQLPRPPLVDVDTLVKKASGISDPVEGIVAKEMTLLIANDAFKYPSSEVRVTGASRPIEVFDDEVLNQARLEIALEMSSSNPEERQKAFEGAWDKIHASPYVPPGLELYLGDEVDKENLASRTSEVKFNLSLTSVWISRTALSSDTSKQRASLSAVWAFEPISWDQLICVVVGCVILSILWSGFRTWIEKKDPQCSKRPEPGECLRTSFRAV